MKSIYRLEIRRAFKNKKILLALLIGMIISVWHAVSGLPVFQFLNEDIIQKRNIDNMSYPITAYVQWIGGNRYSWYPHLYYLLVPLIATIPYGVSSFMDRKQGFDKNLIMKTNRKSYYKAKFLANFLSGGTVVVIPLIINFMITLMYYPLVIPQVSTGNSFVNSRTMLHQLHYTAPLLYIIVYLVITFIIAGLCANLSLIISRLTDYRFIVELGPLFIYIFIASSFELMNRKDLSPVYYLSAGNYKSNGYLVILEILVLFIITFGFVLWKGRRDEIL